MKDIYIFFLSFQCSYYFSFYAPPFILYDVISSVTNIFFSFYYFESQTYAGFLLHTCVPLEDSDTLEFLTVGSKVEAKVDYARRR